MTVAAATTVGAGVGTGAAAGAGAGAGTRKHHREERKRMFHTHKELELALGKGHIADEDKKRKLLHDFQTSRLEIAKAEFTKWSGSRRGGVCTDRCRWKGSLIRDACHHVTSRRGQAQCHNTKQSKEGKVYCIRSTESKTDKNIDKKPQEKTGTNLQIQNVRSSSSMLKKPGADIRLPDERRRW
jgi:hypothetical protein